MILLIVPTIRGPLHCGVYDILDFDQAEATRAYDRSGLIYDTEGVHNLGEFFAAALARMESSYGSQVLTGRQASIAHGAYAKYRHDKGNPTLKAIEWAAGNFGFGVYEFLGFDLKDVRASCRRADIDYDLMADMICNHNNYKSAYAVHKNS